jgi:hypothetical protein
MPALRAPPRQRDRNDAREDHGHRREISRAEVLAGEPAAEHHRDRGIDISVAAGKRWTHVVQQPDICGEADDGSEHDQVAHREQALGRRQGFEALTQREADRQHQHAAAQHLRRSGHERRRQVAPAAPDRTE